MKILITNPSALIDKKTGDFFTGIKEILDNFNAVDGQQTFVISIDANKLKPIPKSLEPFHIRPAARGGRLLIEELKKHFGLDISEIFVLGCKQMDVALAANSKLLLLRADYAERQNRGESIYTKPYGIPIKDAKSLQVFFDKFLLVTRPWYYRCDVSDTTTMYSLTNANTINREKDIVKIADKFRNHLKNGDDSYKEEFLVYFLVSTYAIVNEFVNVDFWGIYPSSNSTFNADLEYYKEKARQSYGVRIAEPILMRHTASTKRHSKSTDKRLEVGCDEELSTIIINPYYKNRLKGKTVCIIDDFTNIGSSCETARALLEKAGVKKLIFITLGKFGKIYKKYYYDIKGDPFDKFSFRRVDEEMLEGDFNNSSDLQFIESLGELVK